MNTKSLNFWTPKLVAALWLTSMCIATAQQGVPLWTNRYNGLGNSDDDATALAVDGSGNVFVTGSSIGSGGDYDFATIKYSGGGVPLWTNYYNGPANSYDLATAIAVDGSGNVVVTGVSAGTSSSADYATLAYSAAGVPLWTNRYNGPGNDIDHPTAVAVDAHGNVFVTGYSDGGSTSDNYATVAYSAAGVPLWTNRYIGPGKNGDLATALAVDGSGNVFVTGYSHGGAGDYDYATIKYSSAGVPLWTNRYDGNFHDFAYAMAVDASGNVVVTGSSDAFDSQGGSYDYATIKYSGTGLALWTNRFKAQNRDEIAAAVAVDSSGNVFVTGAFNAGSGADYATVAYSGAGVPLWANYYNGPVGGDDYAAAIAVDGSGNVIVTGGSAGTNANPYNPYNYDYATIAYSGAGIPLWTNRYNGPGDGDDRVAAIAVDGSGNVFVTGYSPGGAGDYDYATIKYSASGLQPIPLNYQVVGSQLVLSWTNAAFNLQSAPAVQGTYTNISGATSPHTNPISGSQKYFRLRAN